MRIRRWLAHRLSDWLSDHRCPSWQCRWADWGWIECIRNHPDCWEGVA